MTTDHDAALREGLYWTIRNQMAVGIPDDIDPMLVEDYIITREMDAVLAYLREAGVLLPNTIADAIAIMSENEGIVSIKGHGFGPEVHVSLSWDRMGPGHLFYGDTLDDALASALAWWHKEREAIEAASAAALGEARHDR